MASKLAIIRYVMREYVDHIESITGEHFPFIWSADQWTEDQCWDMKKLLSEMINRLDPDSRYKPKYDGETIIWPECSPMHRK